MSKSQLLNEGAISHQIASLEVGQQASAGPDHLEQTAPAVVILGVAAEVVGEGVDPLRQ
jgi:hypothetical protein